MNRKAEFDIIVYGASGSPAGRWPSTWLGATA